MRSETSEAIYIYMTGISWANEEMNMALTDLC